MTTTLTSFDTETTGLNPYTGSEIFSFSIGDEKGNTKIYRLDTDAQTRKRNIFILQDYFSNTSFIKIAHNYKFDFAMVKQLGIIVPEETIWQDTMLLSQCYHNDEIHHSLDYLYEKYSGGDDDMRKIDADVAYQAKTRGSYQNVDIELMNKYQKNDSIRTMLLYKTLAPALKQYGKKAWEDYRVEVELIKVTEEMEAKGIRFCEREAISLRSEIEARLTYINNYLLQISERIEINPRSPKDLEWLLHQKLRLPVLHRTDKTNRPSFSEEALRALVQHDKSLTCERLIEYHIKAHGLSGLNGYEKYVYNGRVHPNIKTNHAETGRESCTNPNLQNVSKELLSLNPYAISLRRIFQADPGHFLAFADESGIEMRLIADATQEPELCKILHARGDVHHPTVECFLGVQEANTLMKENEKRYKEERGVYKNVGFGVAYGAGNEKVSLIIGKPLSDIQQGCFNYRNRFKKIASFSSMMIHEVKKNGFITLPFGRRLYIPKNMAYIASNYRIQGTAAAILKRAQIAARDIIRKKYSGYAFPVLPIHDEIIFSCSRKLLPQFKEFRDDMNTCMTEFKEITTPLDTEWKVSTTTWNKAKKV